MYKGIYIAMTGAVLRSQELDNVANNLANAATVGYKKTSFSSELYPLLEGVPLNDNSLYNDARAMSYTGKYSIDAAEGDMKTTGNPLDLAIKGEGFFAVDGGGKTFYTRNGEFSRSKDGFLVTGSGMKVLDTAGKPIKINGEKVTFSPAGDVFVDGNAAGKLKLAKISGIRHVENSLFSGKEDAAAGGELVQGSYEMSNVNPVRELVGIIQAMREFEAAQKVIQNFDALAQRTVSEVAKV